MPVKGIHVHADGCELNSTSHAYALSNSPFSFVAVLQIRVNSRDGVVRIQRVVLLIRVDQIIVDILDINLREELNGDVGGQVLEFLE